MVFFSILHQIRGNGKGLKVSKPHFFGKIWFICNISKKVHNCFQRWFLNFLDRFVIRFLRKCFFSKLFLTSILQKVPTWKNFSPWIKKWFFGWWCNAMWLKVKRTVKKLLLLTICKYFIICTLIKAMGFIINKPRSSRW